MLQTGMMYTANSLPVVSYLSSVRALDLCKVECSVKFARKSWRYHAVVIFPSWPDSDCSNTVRSILNSYQWSCWLWSKLIYEFSSQASLYLEGTVHAYLVDSFCNWCVKRREAKLQFCYFGHYIDHHSTCLQGTVKFSLGAGVNVFLV